jgi:hypothetical protein
MIVDDSCCGVGMRSDFQACSLFHESIDVVRFDKFERTEHVVSHDVIQDRRRIPSRDEF